MKASVLIVEDEAIVAKDIENILKRLGYEVMGIASSGKEALDTARQKMPELVLMDIKIKGGMDGIETAAKIRNEMDIPVIYLTAYADDKTLGRAKITEPFGYIIKPFRERELHTAIEIALYRYKSEKEKKAMSEKIIKLTRRIPLTDNEKQVMFAMIKFPLMNDIELSKELKIKRSTITAIRNRLKSDNLYTSYKVPNFALLGCELLVSVYADINPLSGAAKNKMLSDVGASPEQVFLISTNRAMAGIGISQNFTEFKKHLDKTSSDFKDANLSNYIEAAYFPYQISSVEKFFDYSSFLNSLFELGMNVNVEQPKKTVVRKLTKSEKRVLYSLTLYKDMNDSEIAGKIDVPRTTLSQIRRRLVKEGLIRFVNVPNLAELRCELMIVSHLKLHPSDKNIDKACQRIRSKPSCVFLVKKELECFSINVYNDYNDYEIEVNEDSKFFNKNGVNIESQSNKILTLPQVQYSKMDFAPLLKKVLDIDK